MEGLSGRYGNRRSQEGGLATLRVSGRPAAYRCMRTLLIGLLSCAWLALPAATPAELYRQCKDAIVAITCRGPIGGYYGTGALVSADGLVLTNITVVPQGAQDIAVHLTDGGLRPASLVGTDSRSEAVLLRIAGERHDWPALPLADDSGYQVGDVVFTWGNPHQMLEEDGQVAFSQGVLSGRYPIASVDDQSRYRGPCLEIDAAVNPGSDGGPVTDARGRVIGVLSLAFDDRRWLGVAIPISRLQAGLPALSALPLAAAPTATWRREHTPIAERVDELRQELDAAVVGVATKEFIDALGSDWYPEEPAERAPLRGHPPRQSFANFERRPTVGLATGCLVDPTGLVLTHARVLGVDEDSPSGLPLRVFTADGASHPARLQAVAPVAEMALVAIDSQRQDWPTVPWREDELPPGAMVAALGRVQAGGATTATVGRVSAVARQHGFADQISASLNWGNLGGPVCDLDGQVIGIASWLDDQTPWRQNCGVGFCLRGDAIRERILPAMQAGEQIPLPEQAFLGVATDPVARPGVLIEQVVPGSAADQAGLLPGDRIVGLAGSVIDDWAAFAEVMNRLQPEETTEAQIERDGSQQSLTITMGRRQLP